VPGASINEIRSMSAETMATDVVSPASRAAANCAAVASQSHTLDMAIATPFVVAEANTRYFRHAAVARST
jgi:hypothetical protein